MADTKTIAETKKFIILDIFKDLTTSISEGLPSEIKLRQKQYESWIFNEETDCFWKNFSICR